MTAVTFGDLAGQASQHLDAAVAMIHSGITDELAIAAAREAGRVVLVLSRYGHDLAPFDEIEAMGRLQLNALVWSALDARQALRLAASSIGPADIYVSHPEPADPLTTRIAAAGTCLAAGRDLLHTHNVLEPDGLYSGRSDWAAVLSTSQVSEALLDEIAKWSRQLALLTARLAGVPAARPVGPASVRHGSATACHWLLVAASAIEAMRHPTSATEAGTNLLMAVPSNSVPERRPPRIPESLNALCEGIAVTAGRLQSAAYSSATEAAWSPTVTAESLQWIATSNAVAFHLGQNILELLSGRSVKVLRQPEARAQLRMAAKAAARATTRWRQVAAAWNEITTETTGLGSPHVEDVGDLVIRLGRLAFADPGWTPARARQAQLRQPSDLVRGRGQIVPVVAVLHHAVNAVHCVAAADLGAVSAAARGQRLYVPTFTSPDDNDVTYRYDNALPSDINALLTSYRAAIEATAQAATALDTISLTLNTPSWAIAAARAAIIHDQKSHADTADETAHWHPAPPATNTLAGSDLPPARTRGPVEQAIRALGTGNPLLVLRAMTIDNAAQALIGQARQARRQHDAREPAREGPSHQYDGTVSQAAAEDFPETAGPKAQPTAIRPPPPVKPASQRAGKPQPAAERRHCQR
jgi:hypothetical protein